MAATLISKTSATGAPLGATLGQPDPYEIWKQDIQAYQEQRSTFRGFAEPYVKRTHKDIKTKETSYNPITQKYSNPNLEARIADAEHYKLQEVLAKNKDRANRYEQTFDIVNFSNKLAGLESRPDYPKEKPWYFRPDKDTNANYNILTTLNLQEHHYDAPDKRPPPEEEKKAKTKKTTTTGLRDYNIITNRYLELHDTKLKVDQEIQRAEAAKKYWETHSFDPVNCRYYEPQKEDQFIQERTQEQQVHGRDQVKKLPVSVQNEGLMYNPINMKIEDQQRLYEKDLREKNKKKRFEVKYDVEALARKQGLSDQDREQALKLNKISHLRFKEEHERGFDILTNDPLQGPDATKAKHQSQVGQPRGVWTNAMKTVNTDFLSEEQRRQIEEEEEQKQVKSQQDFHATQLHLLKQRESEDPLRQSTYQRRSKRLFKNNPLVNESQQPPQSTKTRQVSQGAPFFRTGFDQKPAQPLMTLAYKESHPPTKQDNIFRREIRTGGFQRIGETVAQNK